MAGIVGIGGIFLPQTDDNKRLLKWYQDVLSMHVTEYGINILKQEVDTLITFHRSDEEGYMLNFVVEDIDEYLEMLKLKAVEIKDFKTYDYGKFAHIYDPFGNVIELCELNKEIYKDMVAKEIEAYKNKQ